MSTIAFFHAHPDDEASLTSGSMARAAAHGDRVVVIYATAGEFGDRPASLGEGCLAELRRREAQASAEVIGTAAVRWLGYADSGMTGWGMNTAEGAFAAADVDDAGNRLAAILDEEGVDVLVAYDWHGGYGHPDHIQVHRVAHRASHLTARPVRLLEATMNRDRFRALVDGPDGIPPELDPDAPADDGNPVGTPESELQWAVDVADYLPTKRAALACHASQEKDITMFLSIPDDAFAVMFGTEFYREPGLNQPLTEGWPFDAAA